MSNSIKEPVFGKGLSEFNNDEEMEEDEDEDDENERFLKRNFEKRFLVKRKKLNDDSTEIGITGDSNSIEELMAHLSIDEIFFKAKSDDLNEKLYGIKHIRKLIAASDNHAFVNDFLSNDILTLFVECLTLPNSELQFEAAWIFTNIAGGTSEQTKIIYDAFVHLKLLRLFGSECDATVANQTLWALGNIMADNKGFCYHVISAGITESLIKQMKRFLENVPFLQIVSWIMGQMSHLKDSPLFKETAWDLFPALWELSKQKDSEICTNAIWGLAYLSDCDMDMLMNFDKKVIKVVVPHLASPSFDLQAAALHFLANCVSGNEGITQEVIDCGTLKYSNEFLNHSNIEIVKETLWAVGNILAGTTEQIDAVFKAGLMPKVVSLLEHNNFNIRQNAVWAITNVTNDIGVQIFGRSEYINCLLDLDVIPPLCAQLSNSKTSILQCVVEAINKIQQSSSDRKDEIRQKILASDGTVDRLRELQNHYNDTIQMNVNQILTDLDEN